MKNGPYELVVAPPEYPGFRYRGRYVYEHHLVWWQNTGELVADGEVVHHKNHDKRDNRFDNLEKKPSAQHVREHMEQDRPAEMFELRCRFCSKPFLKEARAYRVTLKSRPNAEFYCSRSCAAKHYGRGRPKFVRVA